MKKCSLFLTVISLLFSMASCQKENFSIEKNLTKPLLCSTLSFQTSINEQMYTFDEAMWIEYNNAFTVQASFQPAEIRIYANNVDLCQGLQLDIENYEYTLESQPVSHYRITLLEEDLVQLVNGEAFSGSFDYRPKQQPASFAPFLD